MPQPTQRLIPFALSVALGVAIAHDVTPAAALTLPAGTLAAEEAAVANAIAASARLGFDASLRVVARADADASFDATPLAWSSGLDVTGTVAYQIDPIARLRAERAVVRAEGDLRDAARSAIFRALRTHADWWAAEQALAPLAERREEAAAALAAGRRNPGSVDVWTLEELTLSWGRADLAWREASAAAASAAASAAATLRTTGTPAYAPLRFALEEPTIADLTGVRLGALAVAEARARAANEGWRGALDDALVTVAWESDGVEVSAEAGIANGRVGARATIGGGGAARPNATVGVRLEVVVRHDGAWRAAEAEAAIDAAEAALALTLSLLPDQWAASRQRVDFAEEGLTLAERALALEEGRAADLRERLAALPPGDAQRAGVLRDLERSVTTRERAITALRSAWLGYVRAVEGHLALTERPWRVR